MENKEEIKLKVTELDKKMDEIFELTDTTTGTTGFTNIWGKKWAEKVIQFGEALRRFDQVCIINKDLVNSPDRTVYLPKSTSHLDMTTSKAEDNTVRTTTEMTNLNTVEVQIDNSNYEQGAIGISKQSAQLSRVNLITQARYAIAQDLADNVDSAIATALQSTDIGANNRVYGGTGNTGVDGLATGDIITTDLIADAMALIEENNFFPKYLFLHPVQLKVFRKDPQFVNASEYGSDAVVMKGEIGTYLGMNVITTTNVPAYAQSATDTNESSTTWGAAGKVGIMVGTGPNNLPVANALVWKEMPSIGYEYDLKRNKHWIYMDQCYEAAIVQPKACALIKTTNA